MALLQKTLPVALDKRIDAFQSAMFTALGFANWESYYRVYLNPKKGKRVPEFATSTKDYIEVFYSDKFSITSFFVADESRGIAEDGISTVDVGWILQADILKLFPAIPHRSDEELINQVQLASDNYVGKRDFRLKDIITGVENVYSEFDTTQMKLDNMSNQFVVRFVYGARYTPDC